MLNVVEWGYFFGSDASVAGAASTRMRRLQLRAEGTPAVGPGLPCQTMTLSGAAEFTERELKLSERRRASQRAARRSVLRNLVGAAVDGHGNKNRRKARGAYCRGDVAIPLVRNRAQDRRLMQQGVADRRSCEEKVTIGAGREWSGRDLSRDNPLHTWNGGLRHSGVRRTEHQTRQNHRPEQ